MIRQTPAKAQTPVQCILVSIPLCDCAQKLGLKDEFPFLVLLRSFIRLVVLPANCLLALPAMDVPHNVAARCHITLAGLALSDVDNRVKEVGFAMLATEVLWMH
jgi:hypothetical protein